ncbi:MAG TPA: HIT domain-containing protein, partial [Holophaga sp.]|nr:HIT domain-containing protein [Holophaga sp.]
MADCLFCKIAAKQIPASIVHEDADLVAFKDIAPQAPVHVLVVPRVHIESLNALDECHGALMGRIIVVAAKLARNLGL